MVRPLVALSLLAACGSVEPLTQTIHSDGGSFHILLTFSEPPVAGEEVDVEASVIDHDSEQPIVGAEVTFEPYMPAHDHGIPDPVIVTEAGDGLYDARFAFSMPGTWEVHVDVDAGEGSERATATVDVQ